MQIKYKPCVATPFAASGFYVYRASYRPVYFPAKRMVPVLDSVIR